MGTAATEILVPGRSEARGTTEQVQGPLETLATGSSRSGEAVGSEAQATAEPRSVSGSEPHYTVSFSSKKSPHWDVRELRPMPSFKAANPSVVAHVVVPG